MKRESSDVFFDRHPEMAEEFKSQPAGESVARRPHYCAVCDVVKPERAHHCTVCQKCYLKMDHHCPWVGNCVGFRNHKFFYMFLLSSCVVLILMLLTMLSTAISMFRNASKFDGVS